MLHIPIIILYTGRDSIHNSLNELLATNGDSGIDLHNENIMPGWELLNITTSIDDNAIGEPMGMNVNSSNCKNAELVLDLSLFKGIIKYLHIYRNFVNFSSVYNEYDR